MKTLARLRALTTRRTGERGQSLIELSIAMPVVLILLLGMLEFGFAFSHHLTLEYATREGARYGAALASGTAEVACSPAIDPLANVDAYIIAAVQRVLTGAGGQLPIAQVKEIRIYKADANGADTLGQSNRWIPGNGPPVDGVQLLFVRAGADSWSPCGRNNGVNPDSLGVSLVYDYLYVTPLGNFMGMTGTAQLRINDRTIMALNPGAS